MREIRKGYNKVGFGAITSSTKKREKKKKKQSTTTISKKKQAKPTAQVSSKVCPLPVVPERDTTNFA
jgi:hypothetical protein